MFVHDPNSIRSIARKLVSALFVEPLAEALVACRSSTFRGCCHLQRDLYPTNFHRTGPGDFPQSPATRLQFDSYQQIPFS